MAKVQATINYENFLDSECSLDDLKQAISKLTIASEQQFEEIKNEKWYNRVFDMITFSRKGDIRISNQIGSIAQAQQILVEILVRLSTNDEVSRLAYENIEYIKKLQQNDLYTLKRVQQIEDTILGIRTTSDISQLSDMEKKVLSGCLYKLQEKYPESTPLQKQYANTVLNYIKSESEFEDVSSVLSQMNESARKNILRCCLEYIFLNKCDMDIPDHLNDFIEEFDFSNKTLRNIKDHLKKTYELRGVDGIISKYSPMNEYVNIDDDFWIDFEDSTVEEDNDNISETQEITSITISSILQIKPDEKKIFSYNDIHINSYIECQGTLVFDNCIITYNESNLPDEITLKENSSIIFRNCYIHCVDFDDTSFITCDEHSQIAFEGCTFKDCSFFLKGNPDVFLMKNCQIVNCFSNFVDFYTLDEVAKNYEIANCYIEENEIAKFHLEAVKEFEIILFKIVNSFSAQEDVKIIFNNKILETATFKKSLHPRQHLVYFQVTNANVSNCSFTGTKYCLEEVASVKNCEFTDCNFVISTNVRPSYAGSFNIDNCCFKQCTDILTLKINTNITNCQFLQCDAELISAQHYFGGVHIEFCEFLNIKANDKNCISLKRGKDKSSKENIIRKCIFNGIQINNTFLIATEGFEKPYDTTLFVEDCTFMNCSTKRDSGKIIKTFLEYNSLFKKPLYWKVVNIINCKGLDNINKEASEITNVNEKNETTSGEKIGATLASGASLASIAGATFATTCLVSSVASIALGPVGLAGIAIGSTLVNSLKQPNNTINE